MVPEDRHPLHDINPTRAHLLNYPIFEVSTRVPHPRPKDGTDMTLGLVGINTSLD